MDSDSSAGDDDLDLVYRSTSPSPSSPYADDPLDFFDDDQDDEPIDRLSTLPNSTLTRIISFLPTKDAIKTSAISKKFQSLWSLSQTLNFSHDPDPRVVISSFVSSIDQTLILHNSPKLTKFLLQFDYVDPLRSSVDRWISFALRRNVEEIDLDLLGNRAICEFIGESYELPFSLRHCSCLTKLSLTRVRFGNGKREIHWNLLRCLSLGYMMLDEALILIILSNCPLLEDFELRECSGFNRLDISSEGLKRLRIYGYGDFCQADAELEIWAPKLGSLGIYGLFRRKIKLIKVESLGEVTLNFRFLSNSSNMNNDMSHDQESNALDCKDYSKLVAGLLSQVQSSKNLTLGSRCIEVASTAALGGIDLPALGTRCLTLETCFDKCNVLGIRLLVALSFRLEKLVLKIQSYRSSLSSWKNLGDSYSSEAVNSWNLQDIDSFACLKRHLKTVQIESFSGSQLEISFAQFLLEQGLVLEKMIIRCKKTDYPQSKKQWEEKQLLEVVQNILSFKRASAKAVVVFSW